ncbi:endothelial PAS domain-containing protein 1 [Aplysia californica]|uniref:Endothelial PAS domain-containing protein 1 n=1 Tax=Aplysia californica TaxID=6500 RepID=A0ABM1A6C0_APLCA|nr:endothelial PAS domain-containing protein 1 [Aplysia californica]
MMAKSHQPENHRSLPPLPLVLATTLTLVLCPYSVGAAITVDPASAVVELGHDVTFTCKHDKGTAAPQLVWSFLKSGSSSNNNINNNKNNNSVGDGSGQLTNSESRVFFLRMKCTLTSKGRNVNLKSASYKVMKCSGRLVSQVEGVKRSASGESGAALYPYLVGIAEPIPHPANIEVPLDSKTFLSKHSMDMHFIFCDDRIQELAGYNGEEMINQSLYDFHHALDSDVVDKAFKDLFSKGQTVTGAYRFLARHGGYMWVVTQATVINNSRTQKPQWVVCVHYVLSGIEEKELILSHVQSPAASMTSTLSSLLPPKLELSTENIFAPKTKDMEKAYFVPPEMKGSVRYLNDEPEDLSYLAPNAGEESVPLSFSAYANDFLLSPAVEKCVLKREPGTGASTPDLCYRKDASPASMMSSNTSSRIASPDDYLSMAVPDDVESMDKFFQSIKTSEQEQDIEDIDFDMRAPYIPMDGDEDLGLLPPSSNVLFNLSTDINPGLFGRTESVFEPKQSLFDEEPEATAKRSVRDMLGGSTAVASIEQPPDTMYLQLKRPLDMNSLEKGPPNFKVLRLDQVGGVPASPGSISPLQEAQPGPVNSSNKDSVLLNLLLRGEDRNYGYKVSNVASVAAAAAAIQASNKASVPPEVLRSHLLPNLTRHDCEVNAPAPAANLLQGRELLRALDVMPAKSQARVGHR